MDLGLTGRVAVVTGGSSGIGFATAQILLQEGADVAICGRDTARLTEAENKLVARYGRQSVLALACDVRKADAVTAFANAVEGWRSRCDILVNNAGQGRVSSFAETSDEAWREELDLKFFSQIYPIRAFKPLLDRSDAPAIVGVNSLLAYQPEPHMVCTSSARAGVQNLLKSLGREFAPRIRVNSILLGLVDSGQWQRRYEASGGAQSRDVWFTSLAREKGIPLGRLGVPEEAARAIAFLASPAASYITGAQLEVSGGVSRFM
jgi:NAD(P)-dependent dehydrogenase (short-subunit alcohol dehydrogenase family)